MKIHVLSDLHIEFGNFDLPNTDADIVILAGDIHVGTKGVEWAAKAIKGKEVIYVIGNHEYYRNALPKLTEKLKRMAKDANIHLLENESVTIGNVEFSGCTLWTDFRLLNNLDISVISAETRMNDYVLIRHSPEFRRLKPSDTAILYGKSRAWIDGQLNISRHAGTKTVVITHHAPSIHSVPTRYKKGHLSAAFASNLEDVILDSAIDLWVHGHIHDPSDYSIGDTRVVCNPRGYVGEVHPEFKPDLTIEI
ncbi:metallophosphoesterase family protein [Desulfosarcina cetonica]